MQKHTMFVGLDVHKESIDIALTEEARGSAVRFWGTIGGELSDLEKAVKKLVKAHPEAAFQFVYEAGPCGYGIYRYLSRAGFACTVVAPSMIPRKSGDRIKTDRRDAVMLAGLHRAGELGGVFVPREEDEAMRDLVRARQDAVKASRVARQQIKSFLLRHGIRYAGGGNWGTKHMNWLAGIKMPHPAQQIALQEYVATAAENMERVERLTGQIREVLPSWRLTPMVEALQALRGVSLQVAVTTVSELGDLRRFETPRQLMSYLGLVPSEHSSGVRRRQGSITKAGNSHVRRSLVEAAQTYRLPARVGREMLARQQDLPRRVREIAWKAQVRLCGRFRKMLARGKRYQTVVCAIARELAAFMWAITREIAVPAV